MATDPNMTSDNQYVGLAPLTLEDIRSFFDNYIRPFAPYREEKVFDTLINNLTEYYYHHLYINVPSELKEFFEDANLEKVELYNRLLKAIGVPNEIILSLSVTDKMIFLKTLSDFEKYKGTVSFFQKVSETFGDRISIYELYIDYDTATSAWVFKPVSIYLYDGMDENIASIPYETIKDAVPSLVLTEEQLTALLEDEKLILPIKSNILLIDNDLMTDVSIMYNIIVAVFLHTYRDNYIDIYFNDTTIVVQLKTLFFLWYYLQVEYYGGVAWNSLASQHLIKFIYTDIGFPAFIGTAPATMEGLSELLDRYDAIEMTELEYRTYDDSGNLRDSLYRDIADVFYSYSGGTATSATDMYDQLVIMNQTIIDYITDRIDNTSIGERAEINLITTEIYTSLVLYASLYQGDSYFSEYVEYFLRYLPQVLVNPENTTSYTILYNLKPYHVELYNIASTGIRVHDKFNQVFMDDETDLNFLQTLLTASVLTFSDDYLFSFDMSSESPLSILSSYNFNMLMGPVEDEEIPEDEFASSEFTLPYVSLENVSDDYDPPEIVYSSESPVSIVSADAVFDMLMGPVEDEEIPEDEATSEFTLPLSGLENVSDDYDPPEIVYSSESPVSIISADAIFDMLMGSLDDLLEILESSPSSPTFSGVSISTISDDYEVTTAP